MPLGLAAASAIAASMAAFFVGYCGMNRDTGVTSGAPTRLLYTPPGKLVIGMSVVGVPPIVGRKAPPPMSANANPSVATCAEVAGAICTSIASATSPDTSGM